jgi:predicted RNA-binding protein
MVTIMVHYYICITNEQNWEVVKNQKVWGVPQRSMHEIAKVKPNDVLIFYVKQRKVFGIFRVITELFKSDERMFGTAGFAKEETFRNRISLEPKVVLKEPIDFRELVPKLKFITQKHKWGLHFWGKAMRTIPNEDYKIIESSIRAVSRKGKFRIHASA